VADVNDDVNDVIRALSAFANDWANHGGGYVVCGAKETKDEHGFAKLVATGLTAKRIKEVTGRVIQGCRERVSPSIAPLVDELPADTPDRRVLVFTMVATSSAHLFRSGDDTGRHYIRVGAETREARNGLLLQLLVRKGAMEPWDRRPCKEATVSDIDLLVLRDALQRMGIYQQDMRVEDYVSHERSLHALVPPLRAGAANRRLASAQLCSAPIRPAHAVPCARGIFNFLHLSRHDRSTRTAERHELTSTLLEQAQRLIELLNGQIYKAFDKVDLKNANARKYPQVALHEAAVSALVHRDYESYDPTRVTAFSDRIEFLSPGSLLAGVAKDEFESGRAPAKWRNEALAWFFNRLNPAQAEGQGIRTILRTMNAEGCRPRDSPPATQM